MYCLYAGTQSASDLAQLRKRTLRVFVVWHPLNVTVRFRGLQKEEE